jgi:hypothetical protein
MNLNHFDKQDHEKLIQLGYVMKWNQDSYQVWYKEEFIYSAGVMLPRQKPLHWKHAKQNREDFAKNAIDAARRDAIKRGLL